MDLNKFHELYDDKGKKIIIIKSENNEIFGAYCDKSWNSLN